MSRTGRRRRNAGKASWELRKLRVDTEIAERQLAWMTVRELLEIVKVILAIAAVTIAMVGMFHTIGLFS